MFLHPFICFFLFIAHSFYSLFALFSSFFSLSAWLFYLDMFHLLFVIQCVNDFNTIFLLPQFGICDFFFVTLQIVSCQNIVKNKYLVSI